MKPNQKLLLEVRECKSLLVAPAGVFDGPEMSTKRDEQDEVAHLIECGLLDTFYCLYPDYYRVYLSPVGEEYLESPNDTFQEKSKVRRETQKQIAEQLSILEIKAFDGTLSDLEREEHGKLLEQFQSPDWVVAIAVQDLKQLVRTPQESEILSYAEDLRGRLDLLTDDSGETTHNITILIENQMGMIKVEQVWSDEYQPTHIENASKDVKKELFSVFGKHLEQSLNQTIRVFVNNRVYMLKPLKYQYWTRNQGLVDAVEIIADTLTLD